MTTIVVDPDVYESASRVFGVDLAGSVQRTGEQLESFLSGLSRVAGSDATGSEWAGAYDRVAGETVQAVDDLGRACVTIAGLLQQSGFNHARAEAHSDVSGRTPVPPDMTSYRPGLGRCVDVPSVAGGAVPSPAGWEWVAQACGAVWPDGDSGKLREMAGAWRAAATGLESSQADVDKGIGLIQSQRSPEITNAVTVCRSLGNSMRDLADTSRRIASSCDELAEHIDKAHQDLIGEVESFVAWTVGIEAAGLVIGALTAGIGEGVAQAGEAARIVALAARVMEIITEFTNQVKNILATLGTLTIDAATSTLKTILDRVPLMAHTRPVAAGLKDLDALAGGLGANTTRMTGESITSGSATAAAADATMADFRAMLENSLKTRPGYDPTGGLGWDKFLNKYLKGFDNDGLPDWRWPDNPPHLNGFQDGISTPANLGKHAIIERIAFLDEKGEVVDGGFAAPPGTPFEELSLPPDRLGPNTTTVRYEVQMPLPPEVKMGKIAQGFEQKGGGTQYYFPGDIQKYVDLGYLKELK